MYIMFYFMHVLSNNTHMYIMFYFMHVLSNNTHMYTMFYFNPVGERLSPYVSVCCIAMAITLLFFS